MIYVREIMSCPPITCRPEETLAQAARFMWDCDCGAVMVTTVEEQLVGIITDRDICMASYMSGRPLHQIQASETMARHVHSCRGEDSVHSALLSMGLHQLRRLPVVTAHDEPIGLISLNNVIRYAVSGDGRLRRELLETLAQVCQPRGLASEHRLPSMQDPGRRSGIFEKPQPQPAQGASTRRGS